MVFFVNHWIDLKLLSLAECILLSSSSYNFLFAVLTIIYNTSNLQKLKG
jgi:hypothetical protein